MGVSSVYVTTVSNQSAKRVGRVSLHLLVEACSPVQKQTLSPIFASHKVICQPLLYCGFASRCIGASVVMSSHDTTFVSPMAGLVNELEAMTIFRNNANDASG